MARRHPDRVGGGQLVGRSQKVDDSDTTPYSFGTISADAMETIAWVSSIAANGFELLFHLISLEEGDYASNIVNGFGATGYGTWKVLKKEPAPWWLEGLLGRGLGTFAASFEGVHTKAAFGLCFKEWLTLAGPDYAEMLSYKYFTELARDLLLSILTLINHKPGEGGIAHPRNREEIDAVRNIFVMGMQNLVLAIGFDRKNWGLLKSGGDYSPMAEFFLVWGLLVGTIVGFLGGLIGSILGESISGDPDGGPTLDKMWYGIPQGVIFNWYWLYLQQEGHTSGGTFNPAGPDRLQGLPEARLVLALQAAVRLDEGRRGLRRPGERGALQPQLQQRRPDLRVRLQPRHERRDPGRAAGHGGQLLRGDPRRHEPGRQLELHRDPPRRRRRRQSDRGARARHGPRRADGDHRRRLRPRPDRQRLGCLRPPQPAGPDERDRGTTVKQGMPIMDAGSTGISFHNHLHMHVIPDLGPPGRPTTTASSTAPATRSRSCSPTQGGDGDLSHFDFYTSANVRRLS